MKKGFTLIELVIVLVIMGVLATLAAPAYLRSIELATNREGLVGIRMLAEAQKMYRLKNGVYAACNDAAPTCAGVSACNALLGLQLKDTNCHWVFAVSVPGPGTFTAQAFCDLGLGTPRERVLQRLQDGSCSCIPGANTYCPASCD